MQVQAVEVVLLAAALKAVLVASQRLVQCLTRGRAFIPIVIKTTKRSFRKTLRTDVSDHFALDHWEKLWGVALQHLLGGLLLVPAATGRLCAASTASVLARHGILLEVAWECADTVERAYQILFKGKEGKQQNPTSFLVITACHHAMGMGLAIPMNIHFQDCVPYFELTLLMQFAAAVAVLIQEYSITLDVGKPHELAQMFWLTLVSAGTMVFTRLIWYWYFGYKVMAVFWATRSWGFLAIGFVVGGLLMPVIGLIFLHDGIKKLLKFGALYLALKSTRNEHLHKETATIAFPLGRGPATALGAGAYLQVEPKSIGLRLVLRRAPGA